MTSLVGVVSGFLVGTLAWRALAPVLASPALLRRNHRGAEVATAGGIVLVAVALVGGIVAGLVGHGYRQEPWPEHLLIVTLLVAGLGFLGLVDDVLGTGESGGFRGHLGALGRGRVTTGTLKLVGGAAVSVVVVADLSYVPSTARLLVDAALVALAANLANLLDRAPGRTLKAGLANGLVLVVAGAAFDRPVAAVAYLLGGAAALLLPDLREQVMLGDTGANVVGGVLGLGAVLVLTPTGRTIAAAVLLALNLASEVVSFSRVIAQVPFLRWADGLGRLPPPPAPGSDD